MGIPPEAAPAEAVAAARFLFGKERRIRKRGEFLRVQQTGLRATSKHFVLLVAAGPDAKAPSRIGIVATKKVGDATMRNRIKRLCRECFRLWPGFLPDGVDLVVIAREGADALTLEKVRAEWERAHGPLVSNCKKALAAGFVAPAKRGAPAPNGGAGENGRGDGGPGRGDGGPGRGDGGPGRGDGGPGRGAGGPGRGAGSSSSASARASSRARGAKRSEK